MSVNLANLHVQGRAKSPTQPWSPEEWDTVCALVSERELDRREAADFVRNGINSIAAYDKAVEEGFKPMSHEDATAKAEADLKARGAGFSSSSSEEKKAAKEAEKAAKKAAKEAEKADKSKN